jgi:hypothetical protein
MFNRDLLLRYHFNQYIRREKSQLKKCKMIVKWMFCDYFILSVKIIFSAYANFLGI